MNHFGARIRPPSLRSIGMIFLTFLILKLEPKVITKRPVSVVPYKATYTDKSLSPLRFS